MGFFKYDLKKLVGSGARVLYAPSSFVVPVSGGSPTLKINSIIELTNALAYAPKSGWVDLGAAREGQGATYDRNITQSDWNIEQATGAVATDITDVPRTMTVQMAEIDTAGVTILENAPASRSVSAASGQSAQTAVDFGSFENLPRYRVAIVGQRRKGIGNDVVEPDATVRGAFVAVVLYSATISANAAQFELQKGQLANIPLEFTAFPESTITDSQKDRGGWLFETAGTIA